MARMPDSGDGTIGIEVAVAWPELQVVVALELPAGACLRDAIDASGLAARFPTLEIHPDRVGVFGELRPPGAVLADGDRVEVYRPLRIDPKQARRAAAGQA